MAFTAQTDPTTSVTQPCPRVPEAEHAACLQLATHAMQRADSLPALHREEETRTMYKLSAWLLESNEESVKVAGGVATADFTSP